jgi:hypothetical protein
MSRWKQIEMFSKMEFSAGHCRPDDGCASMKECHALKRNPHRPELTVPKITNPVGPSLAPTTCNTGGGGGSSIVDRRWGTASERGRGKNRDAEQVPLA